MLIKALSLAAFGCVFVAFILNMVAMATPNWWQQRDGSLRNQVELNYVGVTGRYYREKGTSLSTGYYWGDDTCSDLEDNAKMEGGSHAWWRFRLFCDVAKATLSFVILAFFSNVAAIILTILSMLNKVPQMAAAVASGATGLFALLSILTYGSAVSGMYDSDWDTASMDSKLGYSYIVMVVSMLFALLALGLQLFSIKQDRSESDELEVTTVNPTRGPASQQPVDQPRGQLGPSPRNVSLTPAAAAAAAAAAPAPGQRPNSQSARGVVSSGATPGHTSDRTNPIAGYSPRQFTSNINTQPGDHGNQPNGGVTVDPAAGVMAGNMPPVLAGLRAAHHGPATGHIVGNPEGPGIQL